MPQITKEEALDLIKNASEGNVDTKVFDYLKNTYDRDVAVELIRFDSKYCNLESVKTMLNPARYGYGDGQIKRYNLIGRFILANPQVATASSWIYTPTLYYLKEHYEECMGEPIDDKTIELIDKCINDTKEKEAKEIKAKEEREKNEGWLKNSSSTVYSCAPKGEERISSSPLYVNKGGALSHRPVNSHSRRER